MHEIIFLIILIRSNGAASIFFIKNLTGLIGLVHISYATHIVLAIIIVKLFGISIAIVIKEKAIIHNIKHA
jgi:hypothetical protein